MYYITPRMWSVRIGGYIRSASYPSSGRVWRHWFPQVTWLTTKPPLLIADHRYGTAPEMAQHSMMYS